MPAETGNTLFFWKLFAGGLRDGQGEMKKPQIHADASPSGLQKFANLIFLGGKPSGLTAIAAHFFRSGFTPDWKNDANFRSLMRGPCFIKYIPSLISVHQKFASIFSSPADPEGGGGGDEPEPRQDA